MPATITLTGMVIDQATEQGVSNVEVQIWPTQQGSTSPLTTAVTGATGEFVVQLALESSGLAQSIQFKVFKAGQQLELAADQIKWGGRAPNRTVTIPVFKASAKAPVSGAQLVSDPTKLRFLARNSKRTLREVEAEDKPLVDSIRNQIRVRLRERVSNQFKSTTPELQALVNVDELIPENRDELKVSEDLLAKLKAANASDEIVKEAKKQLRKLRMPKSVDSTLMLDTPLKQNLSFTKELRQGSVYLVTEMAGLPEASATALVNANLSLADLRETKLKELVESNELTKDQATALGLTNSLYSLFEADASLTEALKSTSLQALGGNKISNLKDLVQLDSKDWAEFLSGSNLILPKSETAESYGFKLARTVETVFPTNSFFARIADSVTDSLSSAIQKVQPLLERNKSVFATKNVSKLDWGTLEPQKDTILSSRQEALTYANLYPGLALTDVFDDQSLSADQKVAVAGSRVKLLDTFRQNNDQFELLHLDYSAGSADLEKLNYMGLSGGDGEKDMVLSTVKAYQRIYTASGDTETATAVLAAGFSSAQGIVNAGSAGFQTTTGLDNSTAKTVMTNARMATTASAGAALAVQDVLTGGFRDIPVGNVGSSIGEYFKSIPGFAELFGSQDYCNCEECASIFGAAAYFVDLMYLAQKNILEKVFEANGLEDHLLYLKNRRPDLWTLELTCENTNEMIPQLVIVCEVLENYIARKLDPTISDRTAIEKLVYGDTLPTTDRSFEEPFLLPLKKLEIYLAYLDTNRGDIATTLGKALEIITRATLSLSFNEYGLITTPNTDLTYLRTLYRNAFLTESTGEIKDVDLKEFLSPMGVDRAEFEDLLTTEFVLKGTDTKIESQKSAGSFQNDVEMVTLLTTSVLDRLHRFTRLRKKVSWPIAELDLLLSQLKAAGVMDLDGTCLDCLVDLRSIQDVVGGSVELLCALWGNIPTSSISEDEDSLFDQLFNGSNFTEADGTYPKDSTSYTHPWHRTTSESTDLNTSRLTSGLGVTEQELYDLIVGLRSGLSSDPTVLPPTVLPPTVSPITVTPVSPSPIGVRAVSPTPVLVNPNSFKLTLQNLSLLYRHAALKKQLSLSVQELFQLIGQTGLSSGFVTNLADLKSLVDYYTWQKDSPWSRDEISYVTRKANMQDAGTVPDPYAIAADLIEKVQSDGALIFADTALAYVEGITEEASKAIIQANLSSLIAEVAETDGTVSGYRLMALPDASAMTIPSGGTADASAVAEFLTKYHVTVIVPNYLGTLLGISAEKVEQLIALAGIDLAASSYTEAIQDSAGVSTFETLLTLVTRLQVLYSNELFTPEVLVSIQAKKEIFGISDFTAISISGMQKTDVFVRLVDALGDGDGISVLSALDAYDTSSRQFVSEALRDALGTTAEGLLTCQAQLDLPENGLEALDRLQLSAALAEKLRLDAETLKRCVAEDYDNLTQAAAVVAGAISSASEDEEEETIESLDESLLNTKRDALVDYLIAYGNDPSFEDADELYRYFLIDTQVDGCFETSRVVCAISSVQLYIQRVRLNLEQDEGGKLAGFGMSPALIDDDQWSWRKNYRLWQANRKVFVYPENYIEPDLRDDKTPLFKELESELLQQDITEQNVLDAYASYLEGFEQLATLKIAGSYHDFGLVSVNLPEISFGGLTGNFSVTGSDTLHLFGVTQKDPPVLYYRKIQNIYWSEVGGDNALLSWGAWEEVDLKVPVRKVSPIVFNGKLYLFWVEISSRSVNDIKSGSSSFSGYKHEFKIYYSYLRLDGTWAAEQRISLDGQYPFEKSEGIVDDPLIDESEAALATAAALIDFVSNTFGITADLEGEEALYTPKYDDEVHYSAQEGYTLSGFQWDRIYPDSIQDENGDPWIILGGCNYQMNSRVNLILNSIDGLINDDAEGYVFMSGAPFSSVSDVPATVLMRIDNYLGWVQFNATATFEPFAYCSLYLEEDRLTAVSKYWSGYWGPPMLVTERSPLSGAIVLDSNKDEVTIVNGSCVDGIIDSNGDVFLLQASVRNSNGLLRRIGTTLATDMSAKLFTGGLQGLLDTITQESMGEAESPLTVDKDVEDGTNDGQLDFKGPYGVYFREIFFHIPFLIANHLNSQAEYESAQEWYHYMFNPTSTETITDPTLEEKDRNWRYLEFRRLSVPSLRAMLTDSQAIDAYLNDPFNPHAIARLRPTAYQKSIVMKYIDNLLDWGDKLFTEFEMETVNEAVLLYVYAADILGPRPADIGDCGEGEFSPKTYEEISPYLSEDSQFLIEMEHFSWNIKTGNFQGITKKISDFTLDSSLLQSAMSKVTRTSFSSSSGSLMTARSAGSVGSGISAQESVVGNDVFVGLDQGSLQLNVGNLWDNLKGPGTMGNSIVSLLGSTPVFCVPQDEVLLAYWDRVEDRLYKIRNCMDITGTKRALSLFAPAIDPGLLVRAKAAGLDLEDVLNSIGGDLPPYRFSYLIEKAKSYAGTVQSFGNALLSALGQKDAEELNQLRTTHEQNILKLTTSVREWEIEAAQAAKESLEQQKTRAENRRDYYQGLLDADLSGWETSQEKSLFSSGGQMDLAAMTSRLAAGFHLIAQLGAPTSMNYGGRELGASASAVAGAFSSAGSYWSSVAGAAGLEASFERRKEEWQFQVDQAEDETTQIEKEITAAELRQEIAEKSLEIHEKNQEQTDEMAEFYTDKFTSLGLYTWLSTQLQRLFRDAYNSAFRMAQLAEQAYHFERPDDSTIYVGGANWDSTRSGLLSGESLLMNLQSMEQRFLETHFRDLEITQSFSLLQIRPTALLSLRENGSCSFVIPEFFYDLVYPGQYYRLIKAVRLTIPCVTGPYTNVGATLKLVGSQLRKEPDTSVELISVPPTRSIMIATSNAKQDAGVFELNFEGSRYSPFEGAGAADSEWQLDLPVNFRAFDYNSITDVIVHVSYTARFDGTLKTDVGGTLQSLESALLTYAKDKNKPLFRLFSLKREFPTEFYKLQSSPAGTEVSVSIEEKHFPFFVLGRTLNLENASLFLDTGIADLKDFGLSINGVGVAASDFTKDTSVGLFTSDIALSALFQKHILTVSNGGGLAPDAAANSTAALDSDSLSDIYLCIEYTIQG